MKNSDYKLLVKIIQMKEHSLMKAMSNLLTEYYTKEKVIVKKEYLLAEGNIPIMLVAHLDTVFKGAPSEIYYDQEKKVAWSPQGLGADDRAGVFAIIKILSKGYRPYICFTTGEEYGGIGANMIVQDYPKCPYDLKYIVELDRQGVCDCVFYDCANDDFSAYIESFGFITDWGTFTDISIICPKWEIAGVNLSVGYLREHSFQEVLFTDALETTIRRVIQMLDYIESAPYFEYILDPMVNYYNFMSRFNFPTTHFGYPRDSENTVMCCNCHKTFSEDNVFPVEAKDYKGIKYYCPDCVVDKVEWCEKCGKPFEMETPNDVICPDCAGKQRFVHSVY